MNNHLVCIAPMMKYTDRHFRYFMRLISKKTRLYTEMLTTQSLLKAKNGPERFLTFHSSEHPIAIQLGGANAGELAQCAQMAEDFGYDEINLNVGCPSPNVQNGQFGACLFAKPDIVAECVSLMRSRVKIPVTVKTRIGVDNHDSYEHLNTFVKQVEEAGCGIFIIHARKAWLKGLNPKQNRSVPPLRYDVVYQLKRDFPHLKIILNGGITDLKNLKEFYSGVDGVMIGRAAYQNPYDFAQIDREYFSCDEALPTRDELLQQYEAYICQQLPKESLSALIKPLNGLFNGLPGAKHWRSGLLQRFLKHFE